ncbi:MAG: hypothetical protein ACE5I2_11905 [Anaerolineae bacterium]
MPNTTKFITSEDAPPSLDQNEISGVKPIVAIDLHKKLSIDVEARLQHHSAEVKDFHTGDVTTSVGYLIELG